MQCDVIYLETWGSTQPYVAFDTFFFVLVSLFLAEHTWHWILLHCMNQCLLCLESSLWSWLMDGACFICLVAWGQGTLLASCIRSLTNVSVNCWSDNFEPQQVRIIKLLSVVRSRKWKNSFFVHFQVCWLIEEELVMWLDLPTYPMCLIVLYYGWFHSFSTLITAFTLQWCRMHIC